MQDWTYLQHCGKAKDLISLAKLITAWDALYAWTRREDTDKPSLILECILSKFKNVVYTVFTVPIACTLSLN